jgi:hypothetical protein
MRPKSALVRLGGLLLGVALCATSRWGGNAAPKPPAPARGAAAARLTPDGKEAVASALERLRRTGSFNHPDYPWVVRARRVSGDALYFVEFLRRLEGGKGFASAGNAVQANVAYSEEYQPFTFPFEERWPPERRGDLRVHVGQMRLHAANGDITVEERTFDLPLPARLREAGFRPYAAAEARLSRDQRQALGKGYALRPEQKQLLAAFGDDCADLLRAKVVSSETGQTVLAYDDAVALESGRRYRFPTLAVARFDKAGEVLARFQGKDVVAETSEVARLIVGDDSSGFALSGPGGLRLILPGTKPAR